MSRNENLEDEARALLVQRRQRDDAIHKLSEVDKALRAMEEEQANSDAELDAILAQAEHLLMVRNIPFIDDADDLDFEEKLFDNDVDQPLATPKIQTLDLIEISADDDWEDYLEKVESYAARNRVTGMDSPFSHLMTDSERIEFERRIQDDFTIQRACCDRYDYMIAVTCGMIGGLIDIFFVGAPGTGTLGKWADSQTDNAVMGFAKLFGWNGEEKGKGVASAIGHLERRFKVNYDHATSHATGGAVKNMSMSNHHVKSLGHSPDLVGLFFSILDQFSNTAHFVSNGQLIKINSETFELSGGNIVAKIFAGFTNWLGHLFSDMAGSSGGRGKVNAGRGSGIPIPFYSLLQFLHVGSFGQYRQKFATIAVKVFESGYDLRHGIAMSVPVCVSELLTRMTWTCRARFDHQKPWPECVPTENVPELRRMLLVANGTLCLVDAADAGVRSGGEIVQFLLRTNLIAWVRFGMLALKECRSLVSHGQLDIDEVDRYLDEEYRRLLRT